MTATMPADAPLRLLIHGATGRMGQALLRLADADPCMHVMAAVSRFGGGTQGLRADWLEQAPAFDVAIDFSLPDAFSPVLALCAARGAALVSGTTGLTGDQRAAMDAASARIGLVWAANFSLGIAVLADLVSRAAAALPHWDCDLIEVHHTRKLDAPSGTALQLGAQIEAARGAPPNYASLRAGDVVGEHAVQFTGLGERVELVHRATDRDVFARGALEAARRLHGRAAGRYALADLVFDRSP